MSGLMNTPTELTLEQFNAKVLPHLSKAKRGFASKYPLYDIFSMILYRLATGCQWRKLPLAPEQMNWRTPWHHFNKWSQDGSLQRVFEEGLKNIKKHLDLSVLALDGSHAAAKKGATASPIRNASERRRQIFCVSLNERALSWESATFWRAIAMTALICDATSVKSGAT